MCHCYGPINSNIMQYIMVSAYNLEQLHHCYGPITSNIMQYSHSLSWKLDVDWSKNNLKYWHNMDQSPATWLNLLVKAHNLKLISSRTIYIFAPLVYGPTTSNIMQYYGLSSNSMLIGPRTGWFFFTTVMDQAPAKSCSIMVLARNLMLIGPTNNMHHWYMWCDLRNPVTCRTEWNCKI